MMAEIELLDSDGDTPERLRLWLGGQTYDLGIGFGTGASLRDLLALASGRKPLDERANQAWRAGDATGRGAIPGGPTIDPLAGIEIKVLRPRSRAISGAKTITALDLEELGL